MVFPIGAACLGGTASAGATALGLGLDKGNLELTRECFLLQMRQAKRLWTAGWAEASYRHGEQIMQAAQQHSEAQAMTMAAYFQAEKINSQSFKLARDQDSRSYEMSWRTEARESLRDELMNQFNRFNIIMLCDTVCLGCVYALVVEGAPPADTSQLMLKLYLFCIGGSIALYSISLWCAVTVVRRLHEHTASVLERKLFAQDRELQKLWLYQLESNLPTGPHVMNLVNQAYQKWCQEHIHPLGAASIHMLSIGVIGMFFCAGFLTHTRYMIDYDAPEAVYIFWSTVAITSVTIVYLKCREDRTEKTKQGVYENSWQDSPYTQGPFAKITKAAEELFSTTAVRLGSMERAQLYGERAQMERDFVTQTKSLNSLAQRLQNETERRAQTRKDVLQVLTQAAEELDALPEDLIAVLNKIIYDVDEADHQTAQFVSTFPSKGNDDTKEGRSGMSRSVSFNHTNHMQFPPSKRPIMKARPIDAQRTPVVLGSLRRELGGVSMTTLLRLRNLADEPLRLKSGVQLKEGKYVKDLDVSVTSSDNTNQHVTYHLYPIAEIPARTEVVIAARSSGPNWIPTSGIEGELVFVNKDESWIFRIQFQNLLAKKSRICEVHASQVGFSIPRSEHEQTCWQISKDELDRKRNNEVLIFFDVQRGGEATQAALDNRQRHPGGSGQPALKTGFLLHYQSFGLRAPVRWRRRFITLTPTEIICSPDLANQERLTIPIREITKVRLEPDLQQKNVFDIYTDVRKPLRLAASSPAERDDWIEKISLASGRSIVATRQEEDSEQGTYVKVPVETVEDNDATRSTESVVNESVAPSVAPSSPFQADLDLIPVLHDLDSMSISEYPDDDLEMLPV